VSPAAVYLQIGWYTKKRRTIGFQDVSVALNPNLTSFVILGRFETRVRDGHRLPLEDHANTKTVLLMRDLAHGDLELSLLIRGHTI